MRDDRNPPRDDRVFAIPNIVPGTTTTTTTNDGLLSNPFHVTNDIILLRNFSLSRRYLFGSLRKPSSSSSAAAAADNSSRLVNTRNHTLPCEYINRRRFLK
jgi:hypothetical protein